jgi:8-oxo-dGTP pyrophosphatase MutT (NUDIX family)
MLQSFLDRHQSFGGWTDAWEGAPLDFRVFVSGELPRREWVGSVRALVLRGEQVLLVHSRPPILNVGGRCEAGETIEQTLHREVGEETGWRVRSMGIIGFMHARHLDDQRREWGRPAPDWIDPLFAVEAVAYDPSLLGSKETACEFVPIGEVERHGIETINRTFLAEAVRKRKIFLEQNR